MLFAYSDVFASRPPASAFHGSSAISSSVQISCIRSNRNSTFLPNCFATSPNPCVFSLADRIVKVARRDSRQAFSSHLPRPTLVAVSFERWLINPGGFLLGVEDVKSLTLPGARQCCHSLFTAIHYGPRRYSLLAPGRPGQLTSARRLQGQQAALRPVCMCPMSKTQIQSECIPITTLE